VTENQPPAQTAPAPPTSGPVFAPPVAPPAAPALAPAAPPHASSPPAPVAYGPPAPAPGWAPPPKPGLIPLRPLSLGIILGSAFAVMRNSPQATLLPALVASLLAALAGGLLSWVSTELSGLDAWILLIALAGATPWLLWVYVSIAIDGYTAVAVTRGALGERLNARGVTARTRGRERALVGWATIVIGVIAIVPIGMAFRDAAIPPTDSASIIANLIIGVIAIPVLGGLAAWLGTKLAFVPAALIVERRRLGAAIRRSWALTRGAESFWRVLGIRLLVWISLVVASAVVVGVVSVLLGLAGTLIFANGGGQDTLEFVTMIGVSLIGALMAALGAVITGSTAALLYVDTRMRREGLDLELARYVETPAALRTGDPFLPKAV